MVPPRRIGSASTPAPLSGIITPLEQQLADAAPIWRTHRRKAQSRRTRPLPSSPLAWHTDADLGRPIEVVTDMSKSRKLGFLDYQPTDDSFFDLFTALRQRRIIP